jgi:hypothetical protein
MRNPSRLLVITLISDNRMLTVAEAQTLARKVWKATLLCFSWKRAAAGLVLLGLILTAFGAAIAASGVILTPEQATELASTKWGENRELRAALLDQSAKAWWGLMVIAVGTGMQVVGTIILLVKD